MKLFCSFFFFISVIFQCSNADTAKSSSSQYINFDLLGCELYVIGDSHSLFYDQARIMKSHWTGPIHVATVYQLLKLGLNIFHLKEGLANSDHYKHVGVPPWQCPSGKYDISNIKPGDIVFYSFGFNDIQKNIYKYARDRYQDEILSLLSRYILLLKEFETKFCIICIPISISPNPSPAPKGTKGLYFFGISGDFLTTGSSEERNIYTKYANAVLKQLCIDHGFKFLDIYDLISDSEGFLNKEFSSDYIHLKSDAKVRNQIIDEIQKVLPKED